MIDTILMQFNVCFQRFGLALFVVLVTFTNHFFQTLLDVTVMRFVVNSFDKKRVLGNSLHWLHKKITQLESAGAIRMIFAPLQEGTNKTKFLHLLSSLVHTTLFSNHWL